MKIYNDLMQKILDEGVDREGRNGKTRSLFAQQLRFDLTKGFPAVTTKKLAFNAVKSELLWFLQMRGKKRANDNDLKQLVGKDRTIWTDNAEAPYWKEERSKGDGDLGRVYGIQWRNWRQISVDDEYGEVEYYGDIDQIGLLIDKLKADPHDRRLVVTAWNPSELYDMALPPCHMMFQCYVANGELSLHMIQRSCDMFLGVPFNIASYALLTHMLAQVTGLRAKELIISLNDAHIYHDHFDAVKEQLSRDPFPLPDLHLNPDVKDIDAFKMEDIELKYYLYHPTIKAKMIV